MPWSMEQKIFCVKTYYETKSFQKQIIRKCYDFKGAPNSPCNAKLGYSAFEGAPKSICNLYVRCFQKAPQQQYVSTLL